VPARTDRLADARRRVLKRWRLVRSRGYWERMRGIHAGRRGFVIGNGPSLTLADLERLSGEVTLAANRIYLCYDQTAWRPTYLSVADSVLWPKIRGEIGQRVDALHLVADLPPPPGARAHYFAYRARVPAEPGPQPAFSADVRAGIHGGYTVTFDNLQIAAHFGLDPIYLIGCDHYYAGEEDLSDPHAAAPVREAANHFIAGYRSVGEVVNPAPITAMNRAFAEARRFSERRGPRILNATRGGHLEAFPRVAFDSLFGAQPPG
jgi:hypothetical protein